MWSLQLYVKCTCFVIFPKISNNIRKQSFAGLLQTLMPATLLKRDSNTVLFLKIVKSLRTALFHFLTAFFKELRNRVLSTALVWSLLCVIQLYVVLHFLRFF